MPEPVLLDLDRTQFVEWLRGLEPHAIVGERLNSCCCPLAQYLAWLGAPRPSVGGAVYKTDWNDRDTAQVMPEWAKAFIKAIDGQSDDEPPTSSPTARECLEVLEMVA